MTDQHQPPAVIDDAAFTVRRTIRIAAPVDKVWAAVGRFLFPHRSGKR